MSEKSEVAPDVTRDYILVDASNWAEHGATTPISITVKGIIYSGTVIGGKEWCLKNISLFENSNANDNFKTGMINYFKNIIDTVYSDENIEKNIPPQFIHMVVRYISAYPSGGIPESLWRFKIKEADAVMFGELSVTSK